MQRLLLQGHLRPLLIHGALSALFVLMLVIPVTGETVTDDTGRQVFLPRPPQRLVSLAPSVTEILFFLGLENRLVGVTMHCTYPEAARRKPRIGSYYHLNLEAILALRPDLAIGVKNHTREEAVAALARWGLPVYLVKAQTLGELFELIQRLAALTGQTEAAAPRLAALKARAARIQQLVRNHPRPRVFLQISPEPLRTVGNQAIQDDLIRRAGGINIAGNISRHYPPFSLEQVFRAQPDVILLTSMKGQDMTAEIKFWQRWPTLPAVRQSRIHLVNSDLIDRPGPRLIDGLELLARLFHPNLQFGQQ